MTYSLQKEDEKYYLMQSNALILPSKQSSAMRKTGMLKRHKCTPIRNSAFLVSTQVECFQITINFEINNKILVVMAYIKADAHLNLCGFKHVLYYRTELWSPMCNANLVHKRIFRK